MAESFNSSQSTNTSSNTSSPTVIETPENSIIDAISGVASGLAGQMVNWANGVFSKTSQITDQAVGNFFNVSQQMQGLSNNLTDQYNNVFAPQNRSLAAEADSYNSAARQAVNMGQAGATQAQAGDQAIKNSEEGLRSYGIDPSSGRYAALDKAAAVQNAANVAGAENTQRNADIATGQRLRSEAVQVGATLPAAISNVNNTAIQANTGASNATLANANTGRNLMSLPNDYLKTAMEVKLPPSGQNSQGQSKGQSSGFGSSSSPSNPSNGNKSSSGSPAAGGAGAGGGSGGGAAWMPQHGGTPGMASGVPGTGDYSYNDPTAGMDGSEFQWGGNAPVDYTGLNQGDTTNPFQDPGFGQTYGDTSTGYGGGDTSMTPNGSSTYDPSANATDPGWGSTYDQPSASTDWGSGSSAFNDYGAGGGGGDMSYARGGPIGSAIPQRGSNRRAYAGPRPAFMADGGQVDPSMSPSGGQQTDDVQAQGPGGSPINLNSDEFVIPRDVAMWKGQEFFQKLIEDSRKRNASAPAHGQRQPTR